MLLLAVAADDGDDVVANDCDVADNGVHLLLLRHLHHHHYHQLPAYNDAAYAQ